mgnify:CR=1 FL=1
MRIPTDTHFVTQGINTFSFLGLSLVWGHMLELISLWFLPLTILSILVGYGSEINNKGKFKKETLELH